MTTQEEMCELFKGAQNKRQQVRILAELTDTDVETVVEILRDAGLYVRSRRCKKCGKLFKAYVSPLCRECEEAAARDRKQERARARWIAYEIERSKQRKASLLRQVALVDLEIQRLKEVGA